MNLYWTLVVAVVVPGLAAWIGALAAKWNES